MLGREPAMWLAAMQAVVALAVGFGLALSAEQVSLIMAAAAAVFGLITRSQVVSSDTLKKHGIDPETKKMIGGFQ